MNTENSAGEKTGRMSPDDNELMEQVRDGKVEKLAVLFVDTVRICAPTSRI